MPLVLTEQRRLRFGAFCAFYFAQGVPLGLLSVAIPAWLADQDASVGELALFTSVVSLPWAGKLVAGPFMDRFTFLPMGFRRPWVLFAQAGLTVSLVVLALTPFDVNAIGPLMVVGFVTNAFAATQDVAVDGMAIDVLPMNERGRANAFMAFGQVAGSSSFGALCGTLLPVVGLSMTASLCAMTVAAIFVFVAVVRERPGERLLPWSTGEAVARVEVAAPRVVDNFLDLFRVLLLPMSLLLVATSFASFRRGGMVTPVYTAFAVQDLGMSGAEYSQFASGISFAAAVVGVAMGPYIDRFGARRFLMGALVTGAVCHLVAGLLADDLDDLIV
ncbi:MAG: MFS transporter, partial [Gammaproteobacteria bacterium]|nr:MFS transporter [Gammaproteobacteria bacterium]